jgi:hypothetical protein
MENIQLEDDWVEKAMDEMDDVDAIRHVGILSQLVIREYLHKAWHMGYTKGLNAGSATTKSIMHSLIEEM